MIGVRLDGLLRRRLQLVELPSGLLAVAMLLTHCIVVCVSACVCS